jgi:hypothetical protein
MIMHLKRWPLDNNMHEYWWPVDWLHDTKRAIMSLFEEKH